MATSANTLLLFLVVIAALTKAEIEVIKEC